MSNGFIINHEEITGYQVFVTILDKELTIDEVSHQIFELFGIVNKEILIDAAILNGINNYRFVSAHPQGNFYVFPTEQEVERADDILREYPEKIKDTFYKYRLTSKLFGDSYEDNNEAVKVYSMNYK